jgi:hypothetical protein
MMTNLFQTAEASRNENYELAFAAVFPLSIENQEM